ncbi:hypothetical protein T492DRAFT_151968 [Pavlovales sp. CCMP2436]|nr:hypothetical protein T492DRAFT_151968 [Pavlovales sp. CCMP2436]
MNTEANTYTIDTNNTNRLALRRWSAAAARAAGRAELLATAKGAARLLRLRSSLRRWGVDAGPAAAASAAAAAKAKRAARSLQLRPALRAWTATVSRRPTRAGLAAAGIRGGRRIRLRAPMRAWSAVLRGARRTSELESRLLLYFTFCRLARRCSERRTALRSRLGAVEAVAAQVAVAKVAAVDPAAAAKRAKTEAAAATEVAASQAEAARVRIEAATAAAQTAAAAAQAAMVSAAEAAAAAVTEAAAAVAQAADGAVARAAVAAVRAQAAAKAAAVVAVAEAAGAVTAASAAAAAAALPSAGCAPPPSRLAPAVTWASPTATTSAATAATAIAAAAVDAAATAPTSAAERIAAAAPTVTDEEALWGAVRLAFGRWERRTAPGESGKVRHRPMPVRAALAPRRLRHSATERVGAAATAAFSSAAAGAKAEDAFSSSTVGVGTEAAAQAASPSASSPQLRTTAILRTPRARTVGAGTRWRPSLAPDEPQAGAGARWGHRLAPVEPLPHRPASPRGYFSMGGLAPAQAEPASPPAARVGGLGRRFVGGRLGGGGRAPFDLSTLELSPPARARPALRAADSRPADALADAVSLRAAAANGTHSRPPTRQPAFGAAENVAVDTGADTGFSSGGFHGLSHYPNPNALAHLGPSPFSRSTSASVRAISDALAVALGGSLGGLRGEVADVHVAHTAHTARALHAAHAAHEALDARRQHAFDPQLVHCRPLAHATAADATQPHLSRGLYHGEWGDVGSYHHMYTASTATAPCSRRLY